MEGFNVQNTTLPIILAPANVEFNDVFSERINVYVFRETWRNNKPPAWVLL